MALFGRRPVDATVTALAWNRAIQLERRNRVPPATSPSVCLAG